MSPLSPIVRGQKGSNKKVIDNIRKEGFVRVRIDGETYDVNDEFELEKNKKHTIEVIVDRIVIKENIEARLAGSVETAVILSDGLIICHVIDGEETMYSTKFTTTPS